jgi:phage gp29-like protein
MAAQLLGPDGRPITKEILTREISAPALATVRQVFAPDPSVGLTPKRLAQLLRASEQGDAESYLALAERMEEKDLHYLSVLGTRKRAVAQLDVVVEPAGESAEDEANAELVRAWLKRDNLEDELFDILDAIGKGYSVTEIVWETSEKQWQPKKLVWVDPRWFEIDRVDGRTLRLRGAETPQDLQPLKFVVHTHQSKSGLPIRGGLARIAAWAYLFKNYAVKDWVAFAEIYGQPLRVGKYPPNATPDDRRVLLRAVANIGSDAAAIVPEGMAIEFVEGGSGAGGPDLYAKLCEFLDKQVSKGVLGQTLTTEVGSEGGARCAATSAGRTRNSSAPR